MTAFLEALNAEQVSFNKTEEEFATWLESVEWNNTEDNQFSLFPWQESCTDYLWDTVDTVSLFPWQESCTDYLRDTVDTVTMVFLEDRQRRLIEKLAYSLWEKEGYPDGQDAEHWFLAEKAVWQIV